MLAGILKSVISYFTTSGPGSTRSVEIPGLNIRIREDYIIEDWPDTLRGNVWLNIPHEIHEIPDECVEQLQHLLQAKRAVEDAQRTYKEVTHSFYASDSGKFINSLLKPQSEMADVFDIPDKELLRNEFEKYGRIVEFTLSTAPYNIVSLKVVLIQSTNIHKRSSPPEIIMNMQKVWDSVYYGNRLELSYESIGSRRYPPYRYKDIHDIANSRDTDVKSVEITPNIYVHTSKSMTSDERERYLHEQLTALATLNLLKN